MILIVIDVSENREEQLVLINPEMLEKDGETGIEEGCLSIPDELMMRYFMLVTDMPIEEQEDMEKRLESGELHPVPTLPLTRYLSAFLPSGSVALSHSSRCWYLSSV